MRILLIGPPGSGKGTQAGILEQKLGIPHISSGDMFRQAVSEGTPLGREAETYMSRGMLVPDDVVIGMVIERLSQPDAIDGFILDGFPRTRPQAVALANALEETDSQIDHVIVIKVPDDDIITRVTGRRIDPKTKKIYHVKFNPPPPEVQSRVIHRNDDNEETLRKRLKKFHADTQPIIDFYEEQGLIRRISGLGSMDEVTDRLLNVVTADALK